MYQELTVFPDLTVAENISRVATHEAGSTRSTGSRCAREPLGFSIASRSVRARYSVQGLGVGDRQLVGDRQGALARAPGS